ncbi:MAG: hypothetical protein D4S01_06695 [Dehalococcoidia bacterium]|nr:MAG: hypothetical protein D4S01_06695 [Dehalococcoidia bacterium]
MSFKKPTAFITRYIIPLLLVVLSCLVYGYEYGDNPNQIQVIPFISRIANPQLYPGDYYVDTMRFFPSPYPYIMALLSSFLGLEKLHFILYILFKYLLFVSCYELSRSLFKSRKTALVTMFLFAFSPLITMNSLMGHDPLMKTSFYQTSAVMPFCLFALAMFINRKYIKSFILLAAIYYLNPLRGNFLIIMFSACFLYFWLYREKYICDIKRIKFAFLIFIILMVPGVFWFLKTNMASILCSSKYFVLLLRRWYPGHYFPSEWDAYRWKHLVIFLAYFVFFIRKNIVYCKNRRIIEVFIFTLVNMWVIAFIFGEIIPIRRIILLQFFRSDVFFVSIGLVFAANYIKILLESRPLRDMFLAGLVIFSFIEFSGPPVAGWIIVLFLLHEYIKYITGKIEHDNAGRDVFLNNTVAVYVLIVFVIFAMNIILHTAAITKILFFLILLALFLIAGKKAIKEKYRPFLVLVVLIVVLFPYAWIMEYRLLNKSLSNSLEYHIDSDWKDIQIWAKHNTPIDSVFVVPTYMRGFRVFSERPLFFDWIDAGAMHWRSGFGDQWSKRLGMLGYSMDMIIDYKWFYHYTNERTVRWMYAKFDENFFSMLNKHYDVSYAVREKPFGLNLKPVYENRSFIVYKID